MGTINVREATTVGGCIGCVGRSARGGPSARSVVHQHAARQQANRHTVVNALRGAMPWSTVWPTANANAGPVAAPPGRAGHRAAGARAMRPLVAAVRTSRSGRGGDAGGRGGDARGRAQRAAALDVPPCSRAHAPAGPTARTAPGRCNVNRPSRRGGLTARAGAHRVGTTVGTLTHYQPHAHTLPAARSHITTRSVLHPRRWWPGRGDRPPTAAPGRSR